MAEITNQLQNPKSLTNQPTFRTTKCSNRRRSQETAILETEFEKKIIAAAIEYTIE
ncbi:MAG: hypothetical protein F6K54_30035 [Okeania sp. SIO3B5]|nr:hypothetical protein [Okeania sp. SIO3B5]